MTFAETVAAIKDQGGIVYVPHPFDRLHTIPSPQVLRANVADIDVVEVFNSRLAFPGFNELAERFAQRYRIPAAAGSDAHVLPGIGTALCGIDDFNGPGRLRRGPRREPHRAPPAQSHLPAVAQVHPDQPDAIGQGRRGRTILLHSAR